MYGHPNLQRKSDEGLTPGEAKKRHLNKPVPKKALIATPAVLSEAGTSTPKHSVAAAPPLKVRRVQRLE